jgi:hypothetical protein
LPLWGPPAIAALVSATAEIAAINTLLIGKVFLIPARQRSPIYSMNIAACKRKS